MNVRELTAVLAAHPESPLAIMLPSGEFVPDHFHVTEVGHVCKRFIDCGGTRRETASCAIQIWTADDVDHRLRADKLAGILEMAQPLLGPGDLSVELEYGAELAVPYALADVEVAPKGLLFVLAGRQTDCLARDKCGVGTGDGKGCC